MEFYKLRDKLIICDYVRTKLQTTYNLNEGGEFKGIQYYDIQLKNNLFWDYVPKKYHNNFYTSLMLINSEIPPHTDTSDKTVINVYIEPENCVTEFFKLKNINPIKKQVKNQTDGYLYDKEDLIINSNFYAEQNDVYVLDVTKIHAVVPQKIIKERVVIQLGTSVYNFDDVCDMLRKTGNL